MRATCHATALALALAALGCAGPDEAPPEGRAADYESPPEGRAADYESPPKVRAADVLPKAALEGPHHRVDSWLFAQGSDCYQAGTPRGDTVHPETQCG